MQFTSVTPKTVSKILTVRSFFFEDGAKDMIWSKLSWIFLFLATDLVQAAVACSNTKEDKSVRSRLAKCLDYSLYSEQVINTNVSGSVFGNEEICSRFLTFDIARCAGLIPRNAPQVHKPSACRADQLLIIGAFARNFYSCQNEIDSRMVVGLQRVNSKQ